MTLHNGKTLSLEYEPTGPLFGRLMLEAESINAACDRFLAKRGLITQPSFRNSGFIFGRGKRRARK